MLVQKDITKALKTLKTIGIDEKTVSDDAAAILDSATQTVKAILNKRATMDKQGLQNRPLIVLAGERHEIPAHSLHHLAVLSQLQKKEPKVALAYELSHNSLQKAFKATAPRGKKAIELPEKFIKNDYKSEITHDFAYTPHSYAPFARNILFYNCLKSGIPVKFVDAAQTPRKKTTIVDIHDPSSYESVMACTKTTPYVRHNLDTTKPIGIWARNHHMVKTTNKFARDSGARIIIQHSGAHHVGGSFDEDVEKDLPYEESLRHLFKKAGQTVFTYFLTSEDHHQFEIDFIPKRQPKDILEIPKIPEHAAIYRSFNESVKYKTESRGKEAESYGLLGSYKKESAYVTAVLAKMGMKEYGLSTANYFKERDKHKKAINQRFQTWRQSLG